MPDKTPPTEEEANFRVTDRRRVTPEGTPQPPEGPEATTETTRDPPQPPEAETPPTEQAEQEHEFVLLPVTDVVRIFVAELQARALMHMGLIPHPETRLVAKDLPQAQLAIDCVAALIEQVGRVVTPAEQGQLQQMLAELRLSFVRASGP